MKKILAVIVTAVILVSALAVSSFAYVEKTLCDMTDSEAMSKAQEAKAFMVGQIENYRNSRINLFVLEQNYEAEDSAAYLLNYYFAEFDAALKDGNLYTEEYYSQMDGLLEGAFNSARTKAKIHTAFIKSGWFCSNIFDHDTCNSLLERTYEDSFFFVDTTNYASQQAAIDAYFKLIDYLVYSQDKTFNCNRWYVGLTDVECCLIKQIFYDITGRENPDESRVYTPDTMAAIAAAYERYAAIIDDTANANDPTSYDCRDLKPLADAYSARVLGASEPETSEPETSDPGTTDNPQTFDVAVIALAVSSVVSLAGVAIAKKSK